MAVRVQAAFGAASNEWEGDGTADRFPEIECVRGFISPGVAKAAQDRAARLGVGADRVLVTAGTISDELYLQSLADSLGIAFEGLDDTPRSSCPIGDDRLIEAAAAGMLPLEADGELFLAIAPRGIAARRIVSLIEGDPALAARFRFTTSERLTRFVLRYAGSALAAKASSELKQAWPDMSAAPPRWRSNRALLAIAALLITGAVIFAPGLAVLSAELTLAAVFVSWLILRLCSAFVIQKPALPGEVSDDGLPVYTIMAALYKEAASVDGLLRAIEKLDYPAEKLDVIIAVEADDRATRDAITARGNRVPITVIPVAATGPRTKPKALNFALPFARGTFTVIYDAEDRPQPDQLRRALQAFRAGGERLACVQARLCIDNTGDSVLTRLFTAEYAGQFDVFLPGLTRFGLPLPLGGSSNHFRTATLREVHAWDCPYNVTEDADLGMRLARLGYRSAIIDSTTYEEAPAQFGAWLRQRTRWFKGWMQTWLVHMRRPQRLLRDLGLAGFITFQLIVGGNALAALVHPIFSAGLIYFSAIKPIMQPESEAGTVFIWLYGISVLAGYLASAFLGGLGLTRRGLSANVWILVLTPLHWLLLSLASWRALYQLVVAPYEWEKTEHGLARTSRLAASLSRSLLELERYFRAQKAAGKLPTIGDRN